MIKDIKYGGFSAVPSDYASPDGDLAQSVNLINDDGALKPILPPKTLLTFDANCKVLFIHETSAYKHYIVYDEKNCKLYWCNTDSTTLTEIGSFIGVTDINAVGNTLIVFNSTQMYYILWNNSAYASLGNKLPEFNLSFGLVGHPRLYSVTDSNGTFQITFDKISESDIRSEFSDDNKTKITSQVMAKVNKYIADQTVNKGRFCFPFFVRYALRLYDGSLVHHSAPILMNPSTKAAPLVLWKRVSGKGSYTNADCDIMLVAATLDYQASIGSALIEKWKDIISSVDVFISKPIYTYDQSGEIASLVDSDNFDTKFLGRVFHKGYTSGTAPTYASSVTEDEILGPIDSGDYSFLDQYVEWGYSYLYSMYFSADRKFPSETFHMPEFTEKKVAESISNCANFYKLCSLSLDELKSYKRQDIVVEDDYLQSLTSREVMTDDYLTHDRLVASSSQVYNNRLNLSGVQREAFEGFAPQQMFAYLSHDTVGWAEDTSTHKLTITGRMFSLADSLTISVYIKENGATRIVQANGSCAPWCSDTHYSSAADANNETNGYYCKKSWGCYVFYPNVNAFKMVISSSYGGGTGIGARGVYIIDLKAHDFLNGAYALLDYDLARISNNSGQTLPTVTAGPYELIDVSNKVYTSEVNNPFFFPVTGINTVGTGKIRGIATAAKALSQGQFGQFPLYAFSDEGVWALEVSSTGGYTAKQPITRDVVLGSGESITQIDSAVLFATDRGIMLLSGSTSQCISDSLDNLDTLAVSSMPSGSAILKLTGLSDKATTVVPFKTFIRDCRMVYDYVNQHIIVFNPAYAYAYVYSMKTKLWGMMESTIASTVNSYPEALAMDNAGNLVDFSTSDAAYVNGLIVTRPIKLEAPDVLKTVDTIIQRGVFILGHVQQILQGSRDCISWFNVFSSQDQYLRGFRGTPYKYFRLVLCVNISADESLYGCSVQYTPRLTDRPR